MNVSASLSDPENGDPRHDRPPFPRGWLLVYMVGLALQALHGLGLSVGAIVIFADPARAGLTSFVPLRALLFYVITNLVLALYTVVVLRLMVQRRRAAVANATVLNCLMVMLLMLWHFLGEKSPFGTVVDSVPGLLGLAYILRSKRVRRTFTRPRKAMPVPVRSLFS